MVDLGAFAETTGQLKTGSAVQEVLVDGEQSQAEDGGLDVMPVVLTRVVDESKPHREGDPAIRIRPRPLITAVSITGIWSPYSSQ